MLVIEGFVYAFLPSLERPLLLAASPAMLWLTLLGRVALTRTEMARAAVASGLVPHSRRGRAGHGPGIQIGQQMGY